MNLNSVMKKLQRAVLQTRLVIKYPPDRIPWAIYPKGRIDLSNGVCLCDERHAEEHKDQIPYAMMMSRIRKRQAVDSG